MYPQWHILFVLVCHSKFTIYFFQILICIINCRRQTFNVRVLSILTFLLRTLSFKLYFPWIYFSLYFVLFIIYNVRRFRKWNEYCNPTRYLYMRKHKYSYLYWYTSVLSRGRVKILEQENKTREKRNIIVVRDRKLLKTIILNDH